MVVVIGAGFAGLSAASFMAKAGWEVHVIEKHATPGGRARQLVENGFVFDMGPSWYWMSDVFERYFKSFGKTLSDYYTLLRLDPSYRIYWDDEAIDLSADINKLQQMFEHIEAGAGKKLSAFLKEAAYKYKVGMQKLVFKPGRSFTEFLDWDVITGVFKLDVFTSMKSHVEKYFNHPRLRQILEFPVLFLGALPEKTPALYSLMNYADMIGGTWYPYGGMYSIVKAMHQVAIELGVHFHFDEEVTKIAVGNGIANAVHTKTTGTKQENKNSVTSTIKEYKPDIVIGAADYHFIESVLLPGKSSTYSEKYWEQRTMAPSCLLYYVGLNKRLKNLLHHSLFFDVPFERHAEEIYTTNKWPVNPLFYVSATSVTDNTVAPPGCENLFFLIPVAAGLKEDTDELRDKYFDLIIERMEKQTGQSIKDAIIYKKSFSSRDFIQEYNSFKGNAYGLANTLMQTAIFKPSCRSKKVSNLFYAGQLTVPGPGVPPSLISGEVVANEVLKYYNN